MLEVVLQGFPLSSPINKTYALTGLVGESEDQPEDNIHHHSSEIVPEYCLTLLGSRAGPTSTLFLRFSPIPSTVSCVVAWNKASSSCVAGNHTLNHC